MTVFAQEAAWTGPPWRLLIHRSVIATGDQAPRRNIGLHRPGQYLNPLPATAADLRQVIGQGPPCPRDRMALQRSGLLRDDTNSDGCGDFSMKLDVNLEFTEATDWAFRQQHFALVDLNTLLLRGFDNVTHCD